MLELKTKKELATEAHTLARSHEMVRYNSVTYLPVDFETGEYETQVPDPDRTIWLPLRVEDIQLMAAKEFDTMFATESELSSFDFMVAQASNQMQKTTESLLCRTPGGLRVLSNEGTLVDVDGEFRPNCLRPMLNEDVAAKDRVFSWVAEILGDNEEEAHSLLHHLATSLAPGWSAVKYLLLLGDGRNGKSLLMKMLASVFGRENTSGVTRQDISEKQPTVTDLNGKLLNLVYDGQKTYLKDSGAEKTLIAGEPFSIRKLYSSRPTVVQTNALFVEGLQEEPKTGDKSTALQKRIVRYFFPNVYALDKTFEKKMLSEESVGAFLSLLIDHYVREEDVAEKLAPTARAMELQLEAMFHNSLGLQFLKHVYESDTLGLDAVLGQPMSDIVALFQSWRLKENDLSTWAEPDVQRLFQPLLNSERLTKRTPAGPRKVRVATSLKVEADAFINSLKGSTTDVDEAALVEE